MSCEKLPTVVLQDGRSPLHDSKANREAPMPRISQAVVLRAVEESMRDRAEQERVFKEKQVTKTGRDPAEPWHPFFNPDPQDLLVARIREVEEWERRRFQPLWREIVEGIKAGRFRDKKAIAEEYGKPYGWALDLVKLAVSQRVFSQAELTAYLRCHSGQLRGKSPLSLGAAPTPTITAQRTIGTGSNRLNREPLERVFLARDEVLTVDIVLRLMRLGAWGSVKDFAGEFSQTMGWVAGFRAWLLREFLMTRKEWRACFRSTPWRQITNKYLKEKA